MQSRLSKVSHLIDWGHLSEASHTLLEASAVADLRDPEFWAAAGEKFSTATPPPQCDNDETSQCTVDSWGALCTVEDVEALLRRKSKVTLGGLSGLRPNHFHALLNNNIGPSVWSILRSIMMAPNGGIMWDHLSAAALTPLDKNAGAPSLAKDVRPIAVQDVWLRLLSGVIWAKEGSSTASKLYQQSWGHQWER
jgi:hypothetical protein